MSGRHRAIVGRVQCAEFMDTNEILDALKEERAGDHPLQLRLNVFVFPF